MILYSFSFLSFPSWASSSPLSKDQRLAVEYLPIFFLFILVFVFPLPFFLYVHDLPPPVEDSLIERPSKNQIRFARLKNGAEIGFFRV
jgi:hypothetical protein